MPRRHTRLAEPSKHQLTDPALAARLLGKGEKVLIRGSETGPAISRDGTLLGHLFDSLVTLCVTVFAQVADASVRHLRLHGRRREIDTIVERPDQRVVAMEVKLSAAINAGDVKNLF